MKYRSKTHQMLSFHILEWSLSICTHKAHLTQNIFLPKMPKYDQLRKLCVCAFWVHILGARAGCKTVISYLQHISISYKTYNYIKSYKKSKIGHHFSIFYQFFYPFFTPGFLTFSPVFWGKNHNFFLVPKWPHIAFKSLEQVYLVFMYLSNQF